MNFFQTLKKDKLIREAFILVILLMILFGIIIASFSRIYYNLYYEVEQNAIGYTALPSIRQTMNTTKQVALFISESEEVTQQEFSNYCNGLCQQENSIIMTTYAPNGIVQYVNPGTYEDEVLGEDVIGDFSLIEMERFQQSLSQNTMFATYNEDERIMYIHKAVIRDNVFQGLVTVHVDMDKLADLLPSSINADELVIHTQDGVFIVGNEELLEDIPQFIEAKMDGFTIYYGTIFHGASYQDLINIVILVSLLVTTALFIIFFLVYRHQKRTIQYLEDMEYTEQHSMETGLKNRKTMHDDFTSLTAIKDKFFVAYGTFNNLKFINYKYGYELGLDVLKEAINLINGVLRNTIEMYHVGGDEYAFLFDTDQKNEVQNILNRVLRVFERDIVIKRVRTNISMSLGVVDYPRGGKTLDELIKNASLTLSQSNISNTNAFVFYSHSRIHDVIMNQDFDQYVNKLDLELFDIHLMPIVDAKSERIVGFECLTRSYNEFDEQLDTGAVIASLERSGRIQELDQIVFKKMLTYMININKTFPGIELFLSVNASALSLNEQFVDTIIRYFEDSKLQRGTIVLELTESYKVEDHNYLVRLFKRLNDTGIRTAIDDFGSGYSSLSYISKFPIYSIKVDKTYVRDYFKNNFNRTLFLTLRGIAEVLNCKLIAEGVDHPETLDFLRENGCDWYQGFLYSKSVPFKQAIHMLHNQIKPDKE